MAFHKASSFAENRGTLRRSAMQEENILKKKVALMQAMCRQLESKFGLEKKGITKRIQKNLERSTQTDMRITIIKRSMAPGNRQHYRIKECETSSVLKDAWNNDNGKGHVSALCCNFTIPVALNLLRENNMEIAEEVLLKLEELQNAQKHYAKRSAKKIKTPGPKQNDAMPSNTFALTENENYADSGVLSQDYVNGSPSPTDEFEYDIDAMLSHRTRSHTHEFRSSPLKHPQKNGEARPTSAPEFHHTNIPDVDNSQKFNHETITENHYESGGETEKEDSSLDFPIFDPSKAAFHVEKDVVVYFSAESECPLQRLHAKVHEKLEDVTLIDVHLATEAAKKYNERMDTLIKDVNKWRVPSENTSTSLKSKKKTQASDKENPSEEVSVDTGDATKKKTKAETKKDQ